MIDSGDDHARSRRRTHPDRNKIFSCLGGVVPPRSSPWAASSRCETGDTILLSTDGFWSQIPRSISARCCASRTSWSLLPGLLTEAHRRAEGESDNLSVVAMTWEDQDDPRFGRHRAASTHEQFTTSTNTTRAARRPRSRART